ncbi:PDZ domain-containing protein [Streptococcus sp. zg-86]|uniref:endopeptidase La n=1 Tax=Streptococcus zhangguiae TaxID=2664091 RepID=A0A6I4RIY2_9STRE|nr:MULTISPECIES: SepM family pheromone-processing serine protease [unclassified Streptococcus]MTB64476.1 PDZ domain-containing protein [Streptococcus sp. zg-86]MTB90834.1 PDZ domain-containing protein [Streptococcus sp. zg-36]MWV56463.1 PDZ domain-containing protein [Streptococcus sp. zg-70]QTH47330.1 PDZ domain-containing protein [Streptococcus sp. zg-86]
MKKNKKLLLILSIVLSTVLLWVAFLFPLPYYVESPGGASDIRSVLTVAGKKDDKPGSYNFVYVQVKPATAVQLLLAALDSHSDIIPKQELAGGANSEEFYRISQFYMETSQNMAKYQGLKLAKKDTSLEFFGVYVLNVTEDSTFKQILNIADTVVSVNGKTFKSSPELIDYVSGLTLGSDVEVGYLSSGKELTAKGKIIKLENGKNGIGIGLVDHTEVKSSEKIDFQTGNIGGPSAGLMFTLAIYTQLADPDLRDGRVIAGTGTIEQDGSVGDIGGADKKVLSAAKAGASIFFAPNNPVDPEILKQKPDAKTNYEEAMEAVKKDKLTIQVVPVTNVQEAIDYLKKTKGQ